MKVRSVARGDLATIRHLLRDTDLPIEGPEEQFDPGYAVASDEGVKRSRAV